MCQRITCSSCGKPTFAGCGRHVEAVLGDVEPDSRCSCRANAQAKPTAPSWLRALFGTEPRREGAKR